MSDILSVQMPKFCYLVGEVWVMEDAVREELHYPGVIKVTKMRKMEIRDYVGEA